MDKVKEQLFENATKKLISQLDTMGLDKFSRMQAKNFVLLFRDSFKSDAVKRATFSPEIGNDYTLFPYDSWGFCKASSAAFVSLMNKPKEWRLMYINEIWAYGPHYFIQHIPSGQAFDLTQDQYFSDTTEIPYYMGLPIKISKDTQNTAVRFTHAIGLDFMNIIKNNINAKE